METAAPIRAEVLSDVFAQLVRITLSERVVEALTSAEVTYAQYEALRFCQSHQSTTVGDLSEGLKISYPSATNMVSRLARKGLLQKRGSRYDKRIVRLALTDAGNALVNRVKDERARRIHEIMSMMKPHERDHFAFALDNFIMAAGACGILEPSQICLCCGTNGIGDCSLLHLGEHKCR